MRLASMTHATVFHVVTRAVDIQEVSLLAGGYDPFRITNAAMGYANFGWVAWGEDEPIAVFGGLPVHAGVWQMFLMTTREFPKVALGLTKFAKRTVVPKLFGEIGAHRLQCDLHEKHTFVHRWVEGFGAKREGVMEGYAPDGAAYYRYVLSKAGRPELDKPDKSC